MKVLTRAFHRSRPQPNTLTPQDFNLFNPLAPEFPFKF